MFAECKNMKNINRIPSTVKNMAYTFSDCYKLVYSPAIPKGVKIMEGTFSNCYSIRKAPRLPEGVEDLSDAFCYCINLTEASEIPKSAKNLDSMFFCCNKLKNAPKIKKGNVIKNAKGMYMYCYNLQGEMWIEDALKDGTEVDNFFVCAATAAGAKLKLRFRITEDTDLLGIGKTVDRLLYNKSENSKIIEKPYFENESPVLKKWNIGGDGVTAYNYDTQGDSNVTATLHEDGLFKIEGSENTAVLAFNGPGNTPWGNCIINDTYCNKLIRYVYVGENVGATNITKWFYECENLHKINRLPKTTKIMINTFCGCKKLYTSPEIPKNVEDMEASFYNSGLRKLPRLPEGVRFFLYAFARCSSITEATEIPRSAEDTERMFEDCDNLKKAADIREGNNIQNAMLMYGSCKNLTGEIIYTWCD